MQTFPNLLKKNLDTFRMLHCEIVNFRWTAWLWQHSGFWCFVMKLEVAQTLIYFVRSASDFVYLLSVPLWRQVCANMMLLSQCHTVKIESISDNYHFIYMAVWVYGIIIFWIFVNPFSMLVHKLLFTESCCTLIYNHFCFICFPI